MRVFAFALLAVSTVSAAIIPDSSGPVSTDTAVEPADENSPSGPCVPSKVFKHKCNTCRCANDGLSAVCTIMACPESAGNRDDGAANPELVPNRLHRQTRQVSPDAHIDRYTYDRNMKMYNKPCKPGTFKVYCNQCLCGEDGFFVRCTRNVCPKGVYNPDGTLTLPGQVMDDSYLGHWNQEMPSGPCNPPQSFFKHNCNTCLCGENGRVLRCTFNNCPPSKLNQVVPIQTSLEPQTIRKTRQVGLRVSCEPGKPVNVYCNKCACGPDGFATMCTRMACPEGMYNLDGSLTNLGQVSNDAPHRLTRQVSHNRPCEAGKQFKIFCNDCACGSDGFSVSCTRKACAPGVYNEDGSLKNPVQVPDSPSDMPTGPCEPGKSFKHYCNHCFCGADGVPTTCTLILCPDGVYNRDGSLKSPAEVPDNSLSRQTRQVSHNRPCEAGKQFKIFCNDCACGSDGFSVSCTRKACAPGVYNEDGSLTNAGQASNNNNALLRRTRQVGLRVSCEPGKPVNVYCNKCACGPDGFATMCTRMACPEGMYNLDGSLTNLGQVSNAAPHRQTRQVSHNRPCEAGKQFKIFCNDCACGSDGFSVSCTRKACAPGVYNEDGSLKNSVQVPDSPSDMPTGPCEPGKSFKHYCNHCFCGADGVPTTCTLMLCPDGVYNRDGSLKSPAEVPDNSLSRQTRQVSHNRPCEAGKQFKIFCNDCACGSDGFSVSCTRKACAPGVYNEDGSLTNPAPVPNDTAVAQYEESVPDVPCEPGKSFKFYCNSCRCAADGSSASMCTLMLCPKGIWNKDGSLLTSS